MKILAPSLYAADYLRLEKQLCVMKEEGIHVLHIDVMDGKFVPNMGFGPDFTAALKQYGGFFLDVHLMIEEPGRLVELFAEAGADQITFHIEACSEPETTIEKIRLAGKIPGIALKPETQLKTLDKKILKEVEIVQLMTVSPGLKGQNFGLGSLNKIWYCRKWRDENKLDFQIEVDGGVNNLNLKEVAECGADIIVMGKGVFSGDLRKNIQCAEEVLKRAEREAGNGIQHRN